MVRRVREAMERSKVREEAHRVRVEFESGEWREVFM